MRVMAGRFLPGWLYLYRYYALPAGQDQEEYDAAIDLFAQGFVADSAELPAPLLPAIVRRAVPNARSLLGGVIHEYRLVA
jgi:hypothetical protein